MASGCLRSYVRAVGVVGAARWHRWLPPIEFPTRLRPGMKPWMAADFLDLRINRSPVSSFSCKRPAERPMSGRQARHRAPVGFTPHHHGPGNAGVLVGERHRGELLGLARKQAPN